MVTPVKKIIVQNIQGQDDAQQADRTVARTYNLFAMLKRFAPLPALRDALLSSSP
jgi:hypothetical protein